MLVLCPIQSTVNSSARECSFDSAVGFVDRDFVLVVETSFRGIAFLLFNVLDSISRTECFKLASQLPKRYLNKILIVRFTNIDFLLDAWIVANYQFAYLMLNTVVDYQSSTLVQIVSNTVATPLIKSSLFIGKRFYFLLVFLGLQARIAFVVPLINTFKSFSINQKLMPDTIDTRTQIINTQIQSNSRLRIYRCFYLFININILNLKMN